MSSLLERGPTTGSSSLATGWMITCWRLWLCTQASGRVSQPPHPRWSAGHGKIFYYGEGLLLSLFQEKWEAGLPPGLAASPVQGFYFFCRSCHDRYKFQSIGKRVPLQNCHYRLIMSIINFSITSRLVPPDEVQSAWSPCQQEVWEVVWVGSAQG